MIFTHFEVSRNELDPEFGKTYLWRCYLQFLKKNPKLAEQDLIIMTKKEFQRFEKLMGEMEKSKAELDKLLAESVKSK
jgi:hypothetical protein